MSYEVMRTVVKAALVKPVATCVHATRTVIKRSTCVNSYSPLITAHALALRSRCRAIASCCVPPAAIPSQWSLDCISCGKTDCWRVAAATAEHRFAANERCYLKVLHSADRIRID